FTLKTAGSQTLTASDTATPSLTGSQAGISVSPAAAVTLALSGFPAPTTAGAAGSGTVTALDAYGNTATAYRGTLHLTSSDPRAQLPVNYTFSNTDAGVHALGVTLKTAGTQALTAADTAAPSLTGSQGGIVVSPAGAASLVVSGFPSPVAPGVAAN